MSSASRSADRLASARRVAELIGLRATDTRRLGQQDFRNAGKKHGIDPAALHAFTDVESSGGGFSADGRAIILYEPHVFSKETGGKWDGHSIAGVSCSYPKWHPPAKLPPGCEFHPYKLDQLGRWGLLAFAAELDFDAALRAISIGAYQVLVRNHGILGYPTPWHFVVAMHAGEQAHLDAAIAYLTVHDVLDDMRKGRWREVIRAWNGAGQVDYYLGIFMKRLELRRKAYA